VVQLDRGTLEHADLKITLVIWLPQPLLTIMDTAGGRIDIASLASILGAASVKFYALLGIFALGPVAFRAQGVKRQLNMAIGKTEPCTRP
jgi:hypothetical protein